ncbi:MAG: peptide deformylase [Polyangiaceae bacterium]|nr:peptide deformylase [Polyangiaceae bacterium]
MAARPLLLFETSEAALRRVSEPLADEPDEARRLIADLKDTLLRHPNGIGLAAPQIGVHKRAIVVCFGAGTGAGHGPPIGVINPVILEEGRERLDFDGCLSIPGLYAETVRPHFLRLRGIDERGQAFEWTLDGFDAVVVHHEVDHLNGVLFIDRVSSPDRLHREDDEPEAGERSGP